MLRVETKGGEFFKKRPARCCVTHTHTQKARGREGGKGESGAMWKQGCCSLWYRLPFTLTQHLCGQSTSLCRVKVQRGASAQSASQCHCVSAFPPFNSHGLVVLEENRRSKEKKKHMYPLRRYMCQGHCSTTAAFFSPFLCVCGGGGTIHRWQRAQHI